MKRRIVDLTGFAINFELRLGLSLPFLALMIAALISIQKTQALFLCAMHMKMYFLWFHTIFYSVKDAGWNSLFLIKFFYDRCNRVFLWQLITGISLSLLLRFD